MLKCKMSIGNLKLNVSKLSKLADKRTKAIMEDTARAFLIEAIKHVPVYSGEAKSLLKPLADYVHISLPIEVDALSKYDGRHLGATQGAVANSGSIIGRQKNVWTFQYRMPKNHYYAVNEVMNVNQFGFHLRHPGPWDSFLHAQEAATQCMKTRLREQYFPKYMGNIIELTNEVTY